MASIIPGYEYDIFISYRQKDNKGDRWVSRFVEALKTELEATFKEDVSVYFDENPHDRLQETHNVDKSLEGKLKCLIFIPILSQTYCDPGSYAWQNELLAFILMAENDRYGKNVKLRNGNVTSRILPIRIHDLEPEDLKLFEKETGGVLRAMDFVFKTASGVNRPLNLNEEHPQDNLNKIFYNDQINKVAHAIKEIIQGMRTGPARLIKEKTEQQKTLEEGIKEAKTEEKEKSSKLFNPVILTISAIVVLLLIIVLIIFPGIFREKGYEKSPPGLEKSIAVLPFINDSQDTTNVYFINGLMEGIIIKLSNIKDLRVLSRTSVEQYRYNKTKTISQIASELGVSYIVEGSCQKSGDRVMLSIQLREAESDKQLFSEPYDRKLEDIFNIQGEIATSVAASIRAVITPEETELIDRKPTSNMDALSMYMKGNDLYEMAMTHNNTDLVEKVYAQAIPFFKKAIQLDSTYSDPYVRLGWYIYDVGGRNHDSALYFANRALHFDNKNAKAYALKAWACGNLGLEKDSEEASRLCLQYSPNDGYGYRHMAGLFWRREDYAKSVEYILKAVKFERDPFWRFMNARGFVQIFYTLGFYEEGLKHAEVVIKYNSDSLYYYRGLLGASMDRRDYPSALKTALKLYGWDNMMTVEKLISYYIYAKDYTGALKQVDEYVKMQEKQGKKIDHSFYLGYVYMKNGQKEKSVYHLQASIKNQLLKIKKSQPRPKGSDYFYLAGMYSAMDEKAKASESLKEALKYKDSENMGWDTMMDIRRNVYFPPLDLIRDEPEFKEYIKSIDDKVQSELRKIEKLLKEEANHN